MPLQVDIIINNRYRVLRALGEGGMGAAHLVEDQRLRRTCVIKEVHSHNASSHEQFEVEAQILAGLRHAHLPVVHDFFFEEKSPYIIMEYVQGTTLDRLQAQQSVPFEISDVLKWAGDLLDALRYLHEHDPPVIHRDVKPHNVCITPAGDAVLLDFGIARRLDESKTRTAAQAFSSGYTPIEQYPEHEMRTSQRVLAYWANLRSEKVHTGPYSDIYSLGATLYYALTLLPVASAPMRVLDDELQPVQQLNENVPDYLAKVVHKALAIHPKDRFQSAVEMLAALQPEPQATPGIRFPSRVSRTSPNGNVTTLDQALIYIPAGEFLLGSKNSELKEACHPQHRVEIGSYCIGRFLVTHADYQRFIANQPDIEVPYSSLRVAQPYNWDRRSRTFPRDLAEYPVVLVNWQEALAYCQWLSEVTGYRCRLPTEAEWEKAAAWDSVNGQARAYPWGNNFDDKLCNVDAHGDLRLRPNPVGQFSPAGDSPYGLADMAGNVWEWTSSLYVPYPYNVGDGRENPQANGQRVVRGGAFDEGPLLAHCAWRNGVKPDLRSHNIGFRVTCEAQ